MVNNIKFKPESFFSKMYNNIIMTENQLKNMHNKKVTSSDNKERFNQFIFWKIQQYSLNKLKITLSAVFANDFQQFIIKENFDVFDKVDIIVLRNYLRNKEIYVKKARLYLIIQAFTNVIKEDISWSLNDENHPSSIQQQSVQQLQQFIQ